MKTEIIFRMEAMQSRFGQLQLEDRADWIQDGDPVAFAGESEAEYNERTGRYDDSDNGSLDYLSDEREQDYNQSQFGQPGR